MKRRVTITLEPRLLKETLAAIGSELRRLLAI